MSRNAKRANVSTGPARPESAGPDGDWWMEGRATMQRYVNQCTTARPVPPIRSDRGVGCRVATSHYRNGWRDCRGGARPGSANAQWPAVITAAKCRSALYPTPPGALPVPPLPSRAGWPMRPNSAKIRRSRRRRRTRRVRAGLHDAGPCMTKGRESFLSRPLKAFPSGVPVRRPGSGRGISPPAPAAGSTAATCFRRISGPCPPPCRLRWPRWKPLRSCC